MSSRAKCSDGKARSSWSCESDSSRNKVILFRNVRQTMYDTQCVHDVRYTVKVQENIEARTLHERDGIDYYCSCMTSAEGCPQVGRFGLFFESDEAVEFSVEVQWSVLRLLVTLRHVVAKVSNQFARVFETHQLPLVLLAHVLRTLRVKRYKTATDDTILTSHSLHCTSNTDKHTTNL